MLHCSVAQCERWILTTTSVHAVKVLALICKTNPSGSSCWRYSWDGATEPRRIYHAGTAHKSTTAFKALLLACPTMYRWRPSARLAAEITCQASLRHPLSGRLRRMRKGEHLDRQCQTAEVACTRLVGRHGDMQRWGLATPAREQTPHTETQTLKTPLTATCIITYR